MAPGWPGHRSVHCPGAGGSGRERARAGVSQSAPGLWVGRALITRAIISPISGPHPSTTNTAGWRPHNKDPNKYGCCEQGWPCRAVPHPSLRGTQDGLDGPERAGHYPLDFHLKCTL